MLDTSDVIKAIVELNERVVGLWMKLTLTKLMKVDHNR